MQYQTRDYYIESAVFAAPQRKGSYLVEVDGTTFDLMERFGGLKPSKVGDRQVVAVALGKLLRLARSTSKSGPPPSEIPFHFPHRCENLIPNSFHVTSGKPFELGKIVGRDQKLLW
jgi:hypothetical protein